MYRMRGHRIQVLLTDNERQQLEKISRTLTAPYKLVRRVKIILSAAEEKSHRGIAVQWGIGPEVVTKWIKRWIESAEAGLAVECRLEDRSRPGAPNKFSAEQKCRIVATACEKPEVYEKTFTHWTNHELATEVVKQGIVDSISPRHVGYILKKTMCGRTKCATGSTGNPTNAKKRK